MYMKPCMYTFPFRIMVENRIYFEEKSYIVVKGTPSPFRIIPLSICFHITFWAFQSSLKLTNLFSL